MMNPKINVEGLHESWLQQYVAFAEDHLLSMGKQEAVFVTDYLDSDGYDVEVKHRITVPSGAGAICLKYALAAQSYLSYMRPEHVINSSIQEFPASTFCLQLLLQASYPRNVNTGVFRRSVAGTLVLSMSDGELETSALETREHLVFAGIGVTLMKKFRSLVCPTASDAQAMSIANGYYVSFPN
jgi:hypothetical protein